MRVVLIADTHGALDMRIADAVYGADLLVHAGDVGAGIEDELTGLVDGVVIVHGNNDPAGSGWQQSHRLTLPGGDLVVIHGHQWPAKTRHRKMRDAFADARAIVCGHSHRRLIDDDTTPWILNPGAAGRSRAYGGPGYIEMIANTRAWRTRMVAYEPLSKRRSRR